MTNLYENWNKEPMKSMLEERIKDKRKNGSLDKNIKLSEKLLVSEYFKYWLQTQNNDFKMLKLMNHPLLTNQDYDKIDEIMDQQKYKQLKMGATMTVASCGFYWLFLSRKQFFYNFFNNSKSHWMSNLGKKVLGVYSMYLCNLVMLNLHFKDAVPKRLNQLGMYKKYKLNYEKRMY